MQILNWNALNEAERKQALERRTYNTVDAIITVLDSPLASGSRLEHHVLCNCCLLGHWRPRCVDRHRSN